ncbi:hypothetical protein PILCRDRAFT_123518 [Piloderma croceum F 1598]|uniref:F-box domain-containing protein n=1 Tax=Piloderma croceum (strain F 1598) TaxID=765440 RepID=A0A0C3CRZ1_PILCF|nr:hypothetical protein PILCRDRAFT_123518 [Piloderma croceum F 1598]
MLVLDILLSIIGLSFDDTHTLCQYSLVNKQWSLLARRQLFNDLTIKLCANPIGHQRCHQCISKFARLVASRCCTIPHSIRTLRLSGKDCEKHWAQLLSLVGNPGGMERPSVVSAVMKHFRSVERLEMICLNWFNPSWRSSRTVARFLSPVQSLTLDDVRFYGGPRALFWILSRMPSLDALSMGDVSWPERSGFPNNPSGLLVFSINAAPICPIIFVPLCKLLLGGMKVMERTRPPVSSYALLKPLRQLAVNIKYRKMDDLESQWLLTQAQKLKSVTSLAVSMKGSQEEIVMFQSLLDTIDSLHHLTIRVTVDRDLTMVSSPTLIKHRGLESLNVHAFIYGQSQTWILQLKNVLHTIKSSCMTVIRLAIDMDLDEFIPMFDSASVVGTIDSYLNAIPELRQLRIILGVTLSWRVPLLDENGIEQMLRVAFGRCDANGILSVQITSRGQAADFLESEN